MNCRDRLLRYFVALPVLRNQGTGRAPARAPRAGSVAQYEQDFIELGRGSAQFSSHLFRPNTVVSIAVQEGCDENPRLQSRVYSWKFLD